MSFVKRRIDVEFLLLDGTTFDGGDNAAKVSGLRVSAVIQKAGGRTLPQLTMRIYGLPLDKGVSMNRLTILGKSIYAVRKNMVKVYAYDEGSTPALVFNGMIQYAYADMNAQPDAAFNVQAYGAGFDAVVAVAPTSYPGPVAVADAMQKFADTLGLPLENSGVTGQLPTSYFSGSTVAQLQSCAQHAQVNAFIDDECLAIWPNDGTRHGDPVPISPETGMKSYPVWTQNGISVQTLFNSAVRCGGQIDVTSSITPACGPWYVYSLSHALDSETPGGQWLTQIECSIIGRPVPIV